MRAASERILTQDRIRDCILFPHVPLNLMFFNGCVDPFESMKETMNGEEQNKSVCKCKIQQLLVHFCFRTSCRPNLLTTHMKTGYHSTYLNYRSICPSSVLLKYAAHCSHVIVLVDHWETMDCICICKIHNLKVELLRGVLYREVDPAFPESLIFILSESQMPSKYYAKQRPREAFPTQAGGVESVQPDTRRWAGRFFLAAVLLLGIYMTRIKISQHNVRPAHDSNSTMVMLFTLTLQCFSPLLTVHQTSDWSNIAVGISCVVYLSCALGRTVHVLLACRAAHTVMKVFHPTYQQFRALPFTVLFLWLTFSPPLPNKNMEHWFEDILVEGSVGSSLRSWAVLGQIDLLAALYFLFVSLPALLQSILTKVNVLSVLLHVQMVTSLQNSRVPTKYVLVIKINRLI
ncbi:uncharacterized protein LOC111673679 [Seriola lalandi dorsalis]|uniref:uncharacterized protein LOC111673679 n=1 Tax=Seriola lalandi dorsalis TaxID=1841481 RepID=UPI000C6FB782|nr:uncharacterized protein LOC111673679 [Seriola lalandi dorsalis]